MPDTPDPVAAALDGIRERAERVIALCDMAPARVQQLAEHDVPRLLKAVEDVLKLHQPVTTNGGWLEGREWQECGECGPNNGQENVYAMPGAGEEFWPCPTVRTITAALAGKETGDGK